MIALAGLAVLALGRRWLPAGVRTLVLVGVAAALFWGPILVCAPKYPDMIWSPELAAGEVPGAMFRFWLEARKQISLLPLGLLFGVPIAATVKDRLGSHRPAWRWTEWVGTASAGWMVLTFIGLCWINLDWAGRLAACLWFGVVIWFSHLVTRRRVAPGL